eukprot:4417247-Alexandrium_andersonii.AAC.1
MASVAHSPARTRLWAGPALQSSVRGVPRPRGQPQTPAAVGFWQRSSPPTFHKPELRSNPELPLCDPGIRPVGDAGPRRAGARPTRGQQP